MFRGIQSDNYGAGATATAATVITVLVPPRVRAYSRITRCAYRCAGTAHTIVFYKALGRTTVASAAAGSQAVVNITADSGATPPGAIAASDYLIVQLDSGEFFARIVGSVASLAITLAGNLPSAAAAGNKVWFMGAAGDHPVRSQTTLRARPTLGYTLTCTASVLNDWYDFATGILQSNAQDEPLLVTSNNATAAGTFEVVTGVHTLN